MQNPFAKQRYREKFSAHLGIQCATVQGIDGFLRGVGVRRYNRVEIVVFSHWLTLMGLAFSKAMDDKREAACCVEDLNSSTPRLFEGLCNGVRGSNGEMVIPVGFFPGYYQDYVRSFHEIKQPRCDRYSALFADPKPARHERADALGRVIDEVSRNIMDSSEMQKWFEFDLFTAIRAAAQNTMNSVTKLLS